MTAFLNGKCVQIHLSELNCMNGVRDVMYKIITKNGCRNVHSQRILNIPHLQQKRERVCDNLRIKYFISLPFHFHRILLHLENALLLLVGNSVTLLVEMIPVTNISIHTTMLGIHFQPYFPGQKVISTNPLT